MLVPVPPQRYGYNKLPHVRGTQRGTYGPASVPIFSATGTLALYGDRHGVFKFAGKPRHIPQPVGPTHFSRAMQELGIEQVFARSPQAKGRVERMAGTFQDRLVSKLRLASATTIDEANAVLREFLPPFNDQFRVPAQQPVVAYRSLDPSLSLERILCFKHLRQVARDNTVKYQWRTLQLLPSQERPSFAGVKGRCWSRTMADSWSSTAGR